MSFPITCTACQKTFTVSDEIYEKKVAGRVVTIKCKSCGQGIRIDGSKGAGAAVASSPPATSVEPVVPPEPLWAVDYPDGQDREFTTREVIAELERGVVTGQTLVWRDGMAEWLELGQVAELAPELAAIEARKKAEADAKAKVEAEAAAKAKAEAAKAKAEAAKAKAEADAKSRAEAAAKAKAAPATMHQPRAPMPTVSGLGGSGAANTAKAKAPAGTAPGIKPRAPLGSAPRSPLGSSPELKGKDPAVSASQEITPRMPVVPVPAAAIPPPPVAPAAPAPLPFVAVPEPAVAAAPAPAAVRPVLVESPTPPLPASVAKAVSKPPAPPAALPSFPMSTSPAPTFGNLPAVVADHASVEWPETKKKTRIAIFGVVAAALALGGVVFALSRKDELPPPAPISALPPPATPAPAPTPAPTPTTTSTSRPGEETASGSDPVIATPGAGFAELFAAGARKAESKGATVAPSARFDPASTKAPLAQAATDAQACKQSGGPSGKVTVVVTFDPNGKAAGATITDAPFAGTPTGSCIVAAMKRAVIPPFSGLPGTVSKTFTLL